MLVVDITTFTEKKLLLAFVFETFDKFLGQICRINSIEMLTTSFMFWRNTNSKFDKKTKIENRKKIVKIQNSLWKNVWLKWLTKETLKVCVFVRKNQSSFQFPTIKSESSILKMDWFLRTDVLRKNGFKHDYAWSRVTLLFLLAYLVASDCT